MHLVWVCREMCPEHQAEGLRKQNGAILAPLALADEDLAGGEVEIGHFDLDQFANPHGREEQQFEHDFMINAATIAYGPEEASEFL